jgi:DNA polymerase-3 subunit alpha
VTAAEPGWQLGRSIMTGNPFVHLHCHSHYSLLDGANRIPDLVAKTKELGMHALALTDHGNLFGAIEFYQEATSAGVKPILGYEAYVAPGSRRERDAKGVSEAAFHLTLLAKSEQGFRNLIRMASAAYLEGFYYRPRIDKELLEQYRDGIICLSGCASSEFSDLILKERVDEATDLARWLAALFGEQNFYVEIMDNGLDIQRRCREAATDIAQKLGLPLVATCDTHYLCQSDAAAHDVLLCINTGKILSDTNRLRMDTQEFFLRSPDEMRERFAGDPESLENTGRIADLCDVQLDFKSRHFPPFLPPNQQTNEQYLRTLCEAGLRERYGDPPRAEAVERLEHELGIICRMGFAGYFLVVWDFVRFAREKGIPAGARGSACGALVSYVLDLSSVDPIEFDLLFERFLDPNRNEAPDIDIDFCQERRDEVLAYVREKYGEANVAQIITFGTMAARAAIRDVGRVLDIPLGRVDQIAKLIPQQLGITLEEALENSSDLRREYEQDRQIEQLIDIARKLEGLNRNAGTHAAGVVIGDKPLTEYLPLSKNGDTVTTQWEMGDIEKIGLLKMDFLGLRNLTVLDKALQYIQQTRGQRIDLNRLPLDDAETYRLIQRGETKGVFQLEAAVVRDIVCKMCPDSFRDIIAVNALNRPATLSAGMVEKYIHIKHGREKATYVHPVMQEVLAETHGIMVYQEQVMRILNRLGGIGLSQAYSCIKAISKKKKDIIDENRDQFIDGATARGLSHDKAVEIFDLIVAFGGYGFNKSHSTAYALIAYQTAYLKAHFPAEFMAALLSSEMDDTDSLVEHLDDCRRMGLEVAPPDVNSSHVQFIVEGRGLRYALSAIKGIGPRAVEAIVAARGAGPFRSIFDFCERVDQGKVNKGCMESMIKAGAFDTLGARRAQLAAVLPKAMQGGTISQEDRKRGQMTMFSSTDTTDEAATEHDALPDLPEWPDPEKLAYEKEVLGFYITGHPLSRHERDLKRFSTHCTSELKRLKDEQEVVVGGMITGVKFGATKKPSRKGNSRMARFMLEDFSGNVPCVMFPDDLAVQSEMVVDDHICFLQARVDHSREQVGLIVQKIVPAAAAAEHFSRTMIVRLDSGMHNRSHLERLQAALSTASGTTAVQLEVRTAAGYRVLLKTNASLRVRPTRELADAVEAVTGANSIRLAATNGSGDQP